MLSQIWHREGRYLVILKEITNRYFLTTAFRVTGENTNYDKNIRMQKKGPEC